MFKFITDIKTEIQKLYDEVVARFDSLDAKIGTDVKADAAKVEKSATTEATAVADKVIVEATPAPVVAAVEAEAPKAE